MWVQKAARTEPATLFSPDNTSVTSAAIKWKLKLISGWYSYFSSRFSSYAPRSSGEAGPGFSIKKSCFFIRCSLDTLFSVTMICCPGTKDDDSYWISSQLLLYLLMCHIISVLNGDVWPEISCFGAVDWSIKCRRLPLPWSLPSFTLPFLQNFPILCLFPSLSVTHFNLSIWKRLTVSGWDQAVGISL